MRLETNSECYPTRNYTRTAKSGPPLCFLSPGGSSLRHPEALAEGSPILL